MAVAVPGLPCIFPVTSQFVLRIVKRRANFVVLQEGDLCSVCVYFSARKTQN